MKSLLFTCLSLFSALVGGATFSNPLRTGNGSDPFLVHVDGYYYLPTTTWRDIQLIRAKTIEGPKAGESKTIYAMANPNPEGGNDVWAPELHKVNGTWYVYYSQGRKSWVLTGGSEPWGPYTDSKQVHQEWGIDATLVEITGWGTYYVWSCTVDNLQSLCIAKLVTPTSIGPLSTLSQPTEEWERIEVPVNEGPAGLYRGNKTWIAYSASFCKTPDYVVATLLRDGVGDPLKASSWKKSSGPVFSSANGNYGTAHNGFFTSPDGTEVWNIYHATQNPSGSCGADRQTFAQVLNWDADGSPDFGRPVKAGDVLKAPSGEEQVGR
ncbi:hypothetical protein OQA88_4602 [Cercophora sp. LCS_1]